jgi:hypothetical protein
LFVTVHIFSSLDNGLIGIEIRSDSVTYLSVAKYEQFKAEFKNVPEVILISFMLNNLPVTFWAKVSALNRTTNRSKRKAILV